MTWLTIEQTRELLTSTLRKNGVSPSAIRTAVDGFMIDLKAGRPLDFQDLGTLLAKEGRILLTPRQPVKVTLAHTGKLARQATDGGLRPVKLRSFRLAGTGLTVTDEAATRYFERKGYPRREAERAVHIGRTRKQVS